MARKKQNAFVSYFVPFGIRQLSDILMLVASVLLIIGLSLYKTAPVLIVIGLAMYMAAAILTLIKTVKVLLSGINRRAPEFKNAIANTVIVTVILGLAIFGMVWYFI